MLNKHLEGYLDIHPDVKKALETGKPVVALESTIISHGMPYPKNVETALQVENIIKEEGAMPATIAILKGKLKVGLTAEEIDYLGQAKGVIKTSRRDIPFIVAKGLDGATTVASTMIIAHLAGIKVFATGGIGGVHRGAPETFDISADLEELAQTSVAVVCAGAKSILDIGLTLEYLETKGVPVIGYGTDELPAFYTTKSGFGVDYRVDSPEVLARALKSKWDLGLKGGAVIANPIPAEYAMNYDTITKAINDALHELEVKGIKGKESTPFLLAKVKEITAGKSLDANIQLVYHNAHVGAKLAVALAKLS
jgi:pseudouridine-5'-phosphate glycosidase